MEGIGVAEGDVLAGGDVPLRHQRHAAVRHALHLYEITDVKKLTSIIIQLGNLALAIITTH